MYFPISKGVDLLVVYFTFSSGSICPRHLRAAGFWFMKLAAAGLTRVPSKKGLPPTRLFDLNADQLMKEKRIYQVRQIEDEIKLFE